MPKSNIILESHRFNNKWLLIAFTIKEKTSTFNQQAYKTIYYLDAFKWDMIQSHIQNNFLRENGNKIKAFSLKTIKKDDDEYKDNLENLVIRIKLIAMTSALLDVLDVKAIDSYACYLDITIEDVGLDPSKPLRTSRPSTNDTPDSSERTPLKRRIGTPLPKLRNLPSRRYAAPESDNDMEYKPANENLGAIVPEYVPSAGNDLAMIDHAEYRPEPLNAHSNGNLLQYTPTSKNNGKRHNNSPVPNIRSSKKKQKGTDVVQLSDSQESLVDTLDNVSITGKPTSCTPASQQDLFGSDSETEEKEVEKESSFDALQKKYGSMEPPVEKKSETSAKAGPSRSSALKPSKVKPLKKETNSKYLQTSLNTWTNKLSEDVTIEAARKTDTRKPEMRKTKRLKDINEKKIADLQQKRERIDAEREQIQATNNLLQQQIQQQPILHFNQKLSLLESDTSFEELESKFEIYETDIKKLIKSVKKNQKVQRSSIYTHICRLIDHDILDKMTEILQKNFTRKEKYEIPSFSYDAIISDLIVPEWIFMMFRDEHNLDEQEARDRIIWQAETTDTEVDW